MLRRRTPLDNQHLLKSDSETESDDLSKHCNARILMRKRSGKKIASENYKGKRNMGKINGERCGSAKAFKGDSDVVIKMAKDYQEEMKQLPIPMTRRKEAFVGFVTWQALANSMKQFYGQPLHYLTLVLVKKWDESRIGTTEGDKPMYDIMHPRIAESTIWGAEEVHRICTSHVHLAKLWLSDPDYSAFVGEVIPPSK